MNDYLRRAAKFIFYIVVIFAIVLYGIPYLMGKAPDLTLNEILHDRKMSLFLLFILAYSLVYPFVAYATIKRHLNGSFEDNRNVFDTAFEVLQYIKVDETPDTLVYRKKSKFTRFIQWYEDKVVINKSENPVTISGVRKSVTRIDRIIDQKLIAGKE